MAPKRQPTAEEKALWQKVTETVIPTRRRPAAAAPVEPPPPPRKAAKPAPAPRPVPASSPPPAPVRPIELPKLASGRAPGLDKRTAERLKRGQLPVEARLDLHGLTQEAAHRSLAAFIAAGHRAGRRVLLVITGKGVRLDSGERETGVLKRMVPRWLNEEPTRAKILAFTPARDKDGGSGALYVLLRRQRE
ncbi:MAG: Smr/MutS family protein [Proteobacteria bacterium]|nr:Smr/MutS family protein [Pseudomonadota bacterium]